jgi:hypothetical protein
MGITDGKFAKRKIHAITPIQKSCGMRCLFIYFLLSIESRAKAFLAQLAGLLTSMLMHGRHLEIQNFM